MVLDTAPVVDEADDDEDNNEQDLDEREPVFTFTYEPNISIQSCIIAEMQSPANVGMRESHMHLEYTRVYGTTHNEPNRNGTRLEDTYRTPAHGSTASQRWAR